MRLHSRLLTLALVSLASATAAFGSGFALYEQGSKAKAMGGAFVATADDPTAIFYNVAGLAQQRQFTITAGGTAINFSNQFSGDPNDEFTSGATASYRRHTFVLPNAYVSIPIGTNLTFGIGLMTPFGLRTNWREPYIGRWVSRDANIKTASVEPALAWQTSDGRFAFGAGAEYRRARLTLNRNNPLTGSGVNPFTGRIPDVANVYLASDWTSKWGYSAGLLFKPTSKFRIGASYRGAMDINFKGNATFTQIPTGNPQIDALVRAQLPPNQAITTTLPFPSIAALGLAVTTVPNTDLEFDFTHTTWSRFKSLDVAFANTPQVNLHRPENWKDTNSYRIGVNHAANQHWDVRFGLVYDKNPEPTSEVSPLLPDADREGVSFGTGYHQGAWFIDWSAFILHFKQRSTMGQSADFINGTYKTDAALFSVNLGYKF